MQPQQEMPQPTPITPPPTQQFATPRKILLLGAGFFTVALFSVMFYAFWRQSQYTTPQEKTQTSLATPSANITTSQIDDLNQRILSSPDGKQTARFYYLGPTQYEGDPQTTHVDITNTQTKQTTTYTLKGNITYGYIIHWSPINGRIYFTRSTNGIGTFALWSSNADGTDQQLVAGANPETGKSAGEPLITNAIWGSGSADFSPNGKLIVTTRDPQLTKNSSSLWIMNYDGTQSRNIPLVKPYEHMSNAKWQSDGFHIEFTLYDYKDTNTYITDINGTTPYEKTTTGAKSAVSVIVVNGDIVVTKDGKQTKITSWGYNEKPLLSPDNTKIAYLSKTKESLVNEKTDTGYKRTSTNVWIINIDGSNPIQVTQHKDVVYRNNLHWIDNNRLLFTDGIQSVKLYTLTTKQTATILGPTTPVQSCLDACGGGYDYIFTNDGKYLIQLESSVGHFIVSYITLSTLQAKELPTQQNDGYYHKTSSYNADNKIFSVTITNPEKNEKHYIANLEAGTISPL